MTTLKAAPRAGQPGFATRRAGYIVSVLVNAVLLYGINVWPGWQAVPFLTEDLRLVLGLVNASIIVSLVANVLFLAKDPPWFKALGDAITTSVGLVADDLLVFCENAGLTTDIEHSVTTVSKLLERIFMMLSSSPLPWKKQSRFPTTGPARSRIT